MKFETPKVGKHVFACGMSSVSAEMFTPLALALATEVGGNELLQVVTDDYRLGEGVSSGRQAVLFEA